MLVEALILDVLRDVAENGSATGAGSGQSAPAGTQSSESSLAAVIPMACI